MEEQQTQIKRDVAVKARIKDILEGRYIKEEGWKPNYIMTKYGENIARVNLIGVVVSDPVIDEKSQSLTLDDGSDRIMLRSFENGLSLSKFMLGDVINVIGKPKEYGSIKYVTPEIIKIIDNKKWLEVRKKELEQKEKSSVVLPVSQNENIYGFGERVEEKVVDEDTDVEKTLKLIRDLDKGDGVFIENIIIKSNNQNTEKIISSLIEQGEVFEVQPGKIKVLE